MGTFTFSKIIKILVLGNITNADFVAMALRRALRLCASRVMGLTVNFNPRVGFCQKHLHLFLLRAQLAIYFRGVCLLRKYEQIQQLLGSINIPSSKTP